MMQPTVLIADDDEAIRHVIKALLEESGYYVFEAHDGREAVDVAQAQLPDLAILDVMMPHMDGLTACRLLKSDSRTVDMPILLLTALAQTPSVVEGLESGAVDYITKPFDFDELLARLRSALQIRQQTQRLAEQALTDVLTGLTNRRGLEQHLDQLVAHAERAGEPLSVLLFDADHFKAVNDAYGHPIGDVVLATLAQRARTGMRAQDILGRFGGEEFLALLPCADRDAALSAAERLRFSVQDTPILTTSGAITVTVSVGVATLLPGGARSSGTLLAEADRALYGAKQSGRNRVIHADGSSIAPQEQPDPPEAARALIEALAVCQPLVAAHLRRVSDLCWHIGGALDLFPPERSRIALAGLLHDIGLLMIPVSEPQTLLHGNATRTALSERLADQGATLLQRIPSLSTAAPLVALQYERWDGSGAPRGLQRTEIPLGCRILAVAHLYDALTTEEFTARDHRSRAAASSALRAAAGDTVDPAVVAAALPLLGRSNHTPSVGNTLDRTSSLKPSRKV